VQALAANQAESVKLEQHASDDIKGNAVPHLFGNSTTKEMVKLKQAITAKNALNKSMQTKLGAALQEVEETKKALATTEDERCMITEQMNFATMELNVTNEALIQVKANSAPISTFPTNSSNHIVNVKITGLPTYDGTRTLDAITSFLSTLHCQFGPCAQELRLTDKCGILLTNGWAAAAFLQFRGKAAVRANHRFPAHASAGLAWEDFSATVKEAFIPPDALTRLERDWESLPVKVGQRVSAFNEHFRVFRHQLEPHAPPSNECLRNSYQFKLESNLEASKALFEKLGSRPSVSLNDVMERISRLNAMRNSKQPLTEVTFK